MTKPTRTTTTGTARGPGGFTGENNRTLSDGVYNYQYDAEGNRTTRTHIASNVVTEYTWDHRNRLVKITEKDSGGVVTQVVDDVYDPFNRRLAKVISPGVGPGVVEHFIYDGAARAVDDDKHIALRFDNAGNVSNRYLHGPAVDQILADEQASGDVLWPLADNLGTVRDLAEYDAGVTVVVNHLKYDAFGNVTVESNAAVDHLFGFTGRERTKNPGSTTIERGTTIPTSVSSSAKTPSGLTPRIPTCDAMWATVRPM